MAEQTRDELAADILRSARESYKNRSPRAIARDDRRRAHWARQDATPERERILANMKHTHAHYQAIMDSNRRLSVKKTLTEDDKDQMAQNHTDLSDCPYLQPPEVKASFLGIGPEHYQVWLQDVLWDYLWWADYFGQTVEEYLTVGPASDLYGPLMREALKNSPPMPEGYVVTTRR